MRSPIRYNRCMSVSLIRLIDYFHEEERCRRYLARVRWPEGPCCPRCGGRRISYISTRDKYTCIDCRYNFSVTAGTTFHKTFLPLRTWFIAAYLMCSSKKGISALQLTRMLGISHPTAWFLNHRIRHAIGQAATPILKGIVEVDETWVGGKTRGKGKHYLDNKSLVVGIVERGTRNVVLRTVPNRTKAVLRDFIYSHSDAEQVFTDDWVGYRGTSTGTVNHSAWEWAAPHPSGKVIHTANIEGIWALLKRSIMGSFHYVSAKYLDLYLDELAWRVGNNTSASKLFHRTVVQLAKSKPITYSELLRSYPRDIMRP